MKFIHLSDTHLGFATYRKISESGYNQREEDICQAFSQAIDKILGLKPDFVLHCGDLFDSVRPSNRILHFALQKILKLIQAHIPLILISGNHDTPKTRFVGSVFSIFEALPIPKNLLYVIYKNRYETIPFRKQATIHALPQCTNMEIFRQELTKVVPNPETKNILMLHAGVSGMKEFRPGDFNELVVESSYLENNPFDYIALGHYHGYIPISKNTYFCGSTERLSFNEAGQIKGFLEVNLEGHDPPSFHELSVRPMVDLPTIMAVDKDGEMITNLIEDTLKKINPQDKILRLKVTPIPSSVLKNLDQKRIRNLAMEATHFELLLETLEERKVEVLKTSIGRLPEEYKAYLEENPNLKEEEKRDLENWGLFYLNQVLEE